jgi:2-oxoisovalerate dehydrogenase E1 component alpha subunit
VFNLMQICRVGHHSTSDDSTAYRPKEEIEMWSATENPVGKFRKYLETKGLWSEEEEKSWAKEARKQILDSFNKAENVPKPDWREMFNGVYENLTPALK